MRVTQPQLAPLKVSLRVITSPCRMGLLNSRWIPLTRLAPRFCKPIPMAIPITPPVKAMAVI
jgi:hypothetical protein